MSDTAQQNRDHAAERGVDCAECGHGDPVSMAREGCGCCAAVRWHDPSGRGCALAGRVIAGDDVPGIGECAACIADSGVRVLPAMKQETILRGARPATLTGPNGTDYTVTVTVVRGREVIILRGPRGAEYGAIPYVEQSAYVRSFGATSFFVASVPGMRDPFKGRALFLRFGDRFGWV